MPLFGDCPVCAEKDKRIKFLEGLVLTQSQQLLELTAPGSVARLNYKQPERKAEKDPRQTSHSPRALATLRPDRPSDRPGDKPHPLPRVSEADFEART